MPIAVKSRSTNTSKDGNFSSRKHRFESFNQRLAKIKIEPLRANRRPNSQEETQSSFFRGCLDRWRDTNLSENFTHFANQVASQSESLPQLLLFRHEIFGALNSHILRCDALSAEPLLDLLANLAHDLGAQFEGHLLGAVETLKSLVTGHSEVEVIEWTFNCLAWLFKYLSRLLVPNLVPLLQVVSPLLGKRTQKHYVTRFAAEALSYLVRRAATQYSRDPVPLNKVILFTSEDLHSIGDLEAKANYQHGLMILFSESLKGANRELHSCATDLYRCLLREALAVREKQGVTLFDAVEGITIGLVHHTDGVTLRPVLDIILTEIRACDDNVASGTTKQFARLLLLVTATRKGSRVENWTPVLDALIFLVERIDGDEETIIQVCETAAVLLQYAPFDVAIPHLRFFMGRVQEERLSGYFIHFCIVFNELGTERFQSLVLPDLQRSVMSGILRSMMLILTIQIHFTLLAETRRLTARCSTEPDGTDKDKVS